MSEHSSRPLPDALLGSLYETLTRQSLWPAVVRDITAFAGGTIGALQIRRLGPRPTTSMISSGLEPSFHRAYVEHHYLQDPHLERAASLTEGQTLLSREVLSDEDFQRTPYYNDYCRPQGIRDLMGVMLVRDADLAISFATYAPDSRSFDERDRARLQRLVPHLSRVVRLTLERDRVACLMSALKAEQGACDTASIVVDRSLRVHSMSGAVQCWLGQPAALLGVQSGVLVGRGALQKPLIEAIQRALQGEAGKLTLDSLVALTAPVASESLFVPSGLVNVILVPVAEPTREASMLKLEELPPSLRRVACLMVRGAADKEIASELGMTLQSARTYATRVLKRMGVQSRRELMRPPAQ